MGKADELRMATVTDAQKAEEQLNYLLNRYGAIIQTFSSECDKQAKLGRRTAYGLYNVAYAMHCDKIDVDKPLKQLCDWVQNYLIQENFTNISVSIHPVYTDRYKSGFLE